MNSSTPSFAKSWSTAPPQGRQAVEVDQPKLDVDDCFLDGPRFRVAFGNWARPGSQVREFGQELLECLARRCAFGGGGILERNVGDARLFTLDALQDLQVQLASPGQQDRPAHLDRDIHIWA